MSQDEAALSARMDQAMMVFWDRLAKKGVDRDLDRQVVSITIETLVEFASLNKENAYLMLLGTHRYLRQNPGVQL